MAAAHTERGPAPGPALADERAPPFQRNAARLLEVRALRDEPLAHRSAALHVYENDRFRWLEFDDGVVQCAIDWHRPGRMVLPYSRWMLALWPLLNPPRSALLLGLGGGVLARALAALVPGVEIHAVDACKAVIRAARRHFDHHAMPGHVSHMDARQYLRTCGRRFDLILSDLFDGAGMPPWIAHPAFYDECRAVLSADGALVVNLAPLAFEDRDAILAAARAAFGGRVLHAAVPEAGNAMAFAFSARPAVLARRALAERALVLQARTGLAFPRMLNALAAANAGRRGQLPL